MAYLEIGGTSSSLTSLTITSSGYIQLAPTGTASSGSIRAASTTVVVASRNNAGTNNLSLLETDASDNIFIGNVTAGVRPTYVITDAVTGFLVRIAGNNYVTVNTTVMQVVPANIRFPDTTSTPAFYQDSKTTDAVTNALQIRAQGAYSSASTNINGGVLRLQGGTAKTDGSSGLRGGVRLELSSGGVVMAEVAEVAVGQRVVALAKTSAVTATDIPANAGDGVVFIGNAATEPTANPANGGVLYASAGIVFARQASSVQQCVTNLRIAASMSDADYTCTLSNYRATIMEFTGTLTAGRNVIVPTVSGYQWTVFNNTTGGFAITVKTSGGSGIAIAAGKRAIVYGDGTNIVRVTADT